MAKKKKLKQSSLFSAQERKVTEVVEISDSAETQVSVQFLGTVSARDPNPIRAKLLNQFIALNKATFKKFDLEPQSQFTGDEVILKLKAGIKIGALPLQSPLSAKPDISLIIKPRFGWNGIGPLIASTGWRVLPKVLSLPQLKISERKIPPWVLSSVVLARLESLLKQLDRRFEFMHTDLPAPKGQVYWTIYATERLTQGGYLNIPCRFPDLQDNQTLKAAIHYTLIKQRNSLSTQREFGYFVQQLLDWCESLLKQVRTVAAKRPTTLFFDQFQQTRLHSERISEGLQAMEWTVYEKGLAGLGDLHGLPWQMSMESLFEAFVESILTKYTRQHGAILRCGRKRETITPIIWDPPFLGSQKSLVPDFVIQHPDKAIIFDAKYKDHWEDLNLDRWVNLEEVIRDRHRIDLFQVLAYASFMDLPEITCCLLYPCQRETFESLKARGRLFHEAVITQGHRQILLKLSALPLDISIDEGVKIMRELLT